MSIPDILQQIVATKKSELAAALAVMPLEEVKVRALAATPPRDFFAALTKQPHGLVNIIAEIKKASPSAGAFKKDAEFDPVAIARIYHAARADALSVLTDEQYFGGKLEYLQMVKDVVPLPILRKDFLIDAYQVYQAKAAGADAVLLIAEILSDSHLVDLQGLAVELGMTTLIEVHELESLLRVKPVIGTRSLLGINNRDLRTFRVDLATTTRLAELVENKQILVAESGIKNQTDVRQLVAAGVRSLLIGETLMRAGDVPGTMADLKGSSRAS
ncbi:MAG: indole-3-glycerol phosphate synthase TrpC [Phycisphaerales bacterium]|nr:indole-3-glycerol phosphate synthase TrpC [Phycisphaerales bacterium]